MTFRWPRPRRSWAVSAHHPGGCLRPDPTIVVGILVSAPHGRNGDVTSLPVPADPGRVGGGGAGPAAGGRVGRAGAGCGSGVAAGRGVPARPPWAPAAGVLRDIAPG